ncbi:hypothetical protein D9M72_491040 [compost metagenome]
MTPACGDSHSSGDCARRCPPWCRALGRSCLRLAPGCDDRSTSFLPGLASQGARAPGDSVWGINQLCLFPIAQALQVDAPVFFLSSFALFRRSFSSCRRCKSRRSASICRCSSSRSSGWVGSSLLVMDASGGVTPVISDMMALQAAHWRFAEQG